MIGVIVVVLFLALLVFVTTRSSSSKEYYRDPLYLNVQKYNQDIYPRANGSIYGYPYLFGGSNSLFSGFPQYYTAY